MSQVSFGANQLQNPTPSRVNFWVRLLSAVIGVILLWMQTAPFIPPKLQNILSSILGLIVLILNCVAPFFGVEITTAKVSTDKVTAIDEK